MTRRITLTFDNGPSSTVTPYVLDRLAHHQIKATFFALGSKLSTPEGMDMAARVRAAGHWLGNHTYSHKTPLGLLSVDEALNEVMATERAIIATGEPRRLFRPYGGGGRIGKHLLRREVAAWLIANRYTCVLWNCVPGDWRDPEGWLERALIDVETRDWSLVVLHDINLAAMQHLDRFLSELKSRGHEFTQEFPADCTPIVDGRVALSIEGLVT